jgi:hypothetical protein
MDHDPLVPPSPREDQPPAEPNPDIRGWDVRTVSGRVLGRVRELVVDKEGGEVVAAELDLDDSSASVQVPMHLMRPDRRSGAVFMDSADLRRSGASVNRPATSPSYRDDVPVERRPAVEASARQGGSDDAFFRGDPPASEGDRRQTERRRADRMNTGI